MTTQRLDLLAVIGIAVCWGVVALAWLAGAIYYQSREPAERTRASYLSPLLITTVIMVVVSAAVPMADWRPPGGARALDSPPGAGDPAGRHGADAVGEARARCDVDGRAHGKEGLVRHLAGCGRAWSV